jgi:hypothetical protein
VLWALSSDRSQPPRHLGEAKWTSARCPADTAHLPPRMHRKLVETVRAGFQIIETVIKSGLTDRAAYRLESRMIGEFHKFRAVAGPSISRHGTTGTSMRATGNGACDDLPGTRKRWTQNSTETLGFSAMQARTVVSHSRRPRAMRWGCPSAIRRALSKDRPPPRPASRLASGMIEAIWILIVVYGDLGPTIRP